MTGALNTSLRGEGSHRWDGVLPGDQRGSHPWDVVLQPGKGHSHQWAVVLPGGKRGSHRWEELLPGDQRGSHRWEVLLPTGKRGSHSGRRHFAVQKPDARRARIILHALGRFAPRGQAMLRCRRALPRLLETFRFCKMTFAQLPKACCDYKRSMPGAKAIFCCNLASSHVLWARCTGNCPTSAGRRRVSARNGHLPGSGRHFARQMAACPRECVLFGLQGLAPASGGERRRAETKALVTSSLWHKLGQRSRRKTTSACEKVSRPKRASWSSGGSSSISETTLPQSSSSTSRRLFLQSCVVIRPRWN